MAALISAAATIVAAAVAAVIALHPWSSDGLQLGISDEYSSVVDGTTVIVVTGTVANLNGDFFVYAFAGRQPRKTPWYPSGPAAISGNGTWTAEIGGLPASGRARFAVWAGVAALPPTPPQCTPTPLNSNSYSGCPDSAVQANLRGILATEGLHAPELKLVTPPRHVVLRGA